MAQTFMPETNYQKLIAALLTMEPCAVSGEITDNEIKIALAEFGDIWPASIQFDMIRDGITDIE